MSTSLIPFVPEYLKAQLESHKLLDCGLEFAPHPPVCASVAQLTKIAESIRWLRTGEKQVFKVKFARNLFCDDSLFAIISWEDSESPRFSPAAIILSGSLGLSVGPRGGKRVVSFYHSGGSTKEYCKSMAEHIAHLLKAKLSKGKVEQLIP